MRTIITVITLLLTTCCWCQQNDTIANFIIENNTARWVKVYEQGGKQIAQHVATFANISTTDNRILGTTNETSLPVDASGVDRKHAPLEYISNNKSIVTFQIDIKDDRYRVIVYDVTMTYTLQTSLTGPGMTQQTTLYKLALKNGGKVRSLFKSAYSAPLDKILTYMFTIPEQKSSEDW